MSDDEGNLEKLDKMAKGCKIFLFEVKQSQWSSQWNENNSSISFAYFCYQYVEYQGFLPKKNSKTFIKEISWTKNKRSGKIKRRKILKRLPENSCDRPEVSRGFFQKEQKTFCPSINLIPSKLYLLIPFQKLRSHGNIFKKWKYFQKTDHQYNRWTAKKPREGHNPAIAGRLLIRKNTKNLKLLIAHPFTMNTM